ncbi:MAG: hypothetical protein LC722_07885, partial [Actinobacteria bacterium]|nr:hypothetical protein [Actinomycetota bacterium]
AVNIAAVSQPPPAPSPAAGRLANRRGLIIAAAAGALAAIVLLVVLVAAGGRSKLRGGLDDPDAQGGGPPGGPIPVDGRPIPGEGNAMILGGGVMGFAVPGGWTVLARGDNKPGPGGHPEGAVLYNAGVGVTFGAYVLPQSADLASRINEEAQARAQEWTKDGDQVAMDAAQPFETGGSITAAVSLRYRYVQRGTGGGPREGQLILAVRGDGFAVAIFVDAIQDGGLEGNVGLWGPLRTAALSNFASG